MNDKIKKFAEVVQQQTLENLNKNYPVDFNVSPNFWIKDAETKIKDGQKYVKVDVGRSGKYMIEKETENIYGIKAYGVIHRGKKYGNLDTIDQYFLGGYGPRKL